ncbi:MAG: type II toxin-antitoxin system HicB family antitoxin [Ignavibacteria bacterium]|nr:type II toxin-antitoxin system HicB family antitoxin [Ignavibacteria bacterium]
MEYTVIIEKSKNGYGAFTPDLPGVGVVGDTKKEVIISIKKAIKMYLEEVSESGNKIPEPTTEVLKFEIAI